MTADTILEMVGPTVIAVPIFVALIVTEFFHARRRGSDEYGEPIDTWTNILVGLASLLWGALFALGYAFVYDWCYSVAPYKFPVDAWWSWVVLFFVDDFAYYWFHRFAHETRFLWNYHVVHHSSRHYNFSVAVRQSWFSGTVHWIFFAPIMLLGFPPWMFVTMHGFNLIYQFWIHTRFVGRMGWLEKVINTPSHHRVHHGVNEQYLDRNYAGVLIIWDRMFGTFTEETEEPRYGITKQLDSYNPFWINTHAWLEMWRELRKRKGWLQKIRCVFGSPDMRTPRSEA